MLFFPSLSFCCVCNPMCLGLDSTIILYLGTGSFSGFIMKVYAKTGKTGTLLELSLLPNSMVRREIQLINKFWSCIRASRVQYVASSSLSTAWYRLWNGSHSSMDRTTLAVEDKPAAEDSYLCVQYLLYLYTWARSSQLKALKATDFNGKETQAPDPSTKPRQIQSESDLLSAEKINAPKVSTPKR